MTLNILVTFLLTWCEPLPEEKVCACRKDALEFANSDEEQDPDDDGDGDDVNEVDGDNEVDDENDHCNT